MMKKLKGSRIEIKREIPSEAWGKHIDSAVSELGSEFRFPGFRPGKAPRNMLEKKIGKAAILENAAEKAIRKDYADYVTAENLEVLGVPEVKIEKLDEGEALAYAAVVAVMPEVSIAEKYKEEIRKANSELAGKTTAADEEELKLELERLANSRAKLVTVEREAKNDDAVIVDFTVSMGGVPIENGTSKDHPLVIGKGVFIPGFEEQLVGMKAGDEKEFELRFPKDYHKKDLQDKPASFKVGMKLVQERAVPAVDDEFAKSLGNFADLEALKKSIREGMEHENRHKLQEEKRGRYVDAIVAHFEGELPEILITEEAKKMLLEFEQQVGSTGMVLDDYLAKLGKNRQDLEKDWQPQAEKRVKSSLGLKEIAKAEKIEIAQKEVEEEMNRTLQYYKNVKNLEKNIDLERLYAYSRNVLENDKVFELLEGLV